MMWPLLAKECVCEWFQDFKNGNFHVENRNKRGRDVFKDAKLRPLLNGI